MAVATRAMVSLRREAIAGGWSPPCCPSNNSTSHHLFLVRFAGGDLRGCDPAVGCVSAGWALSVGALAVNAQAVMVVEGQRWRRHWRLRMFVAVVCVRKGQKSVTFW
jgi:hypothetical protein